MFLYYNLTSGLNFETGIIEATLTKLGHRGKVALPKIAFGNLI